MHRAARQRCDLVNVEGFDPNEEKKEDGNMKELLLVSNNWRAITPDASPTTARHPPSNSRLLLLMCVLSMCFFSFGFIAGIQLRLRQHDWNSKDHHFSETSDTSALPNKKLQLRQLQASNYRNGTALWFHFHLTYTGGTTVYNMAKRLGPVPASVGGNWDPSFNAMGVPTTPWSHEETDTAIRILRGAQFHWLGLERGRRDLHRSINETNWEHENLFSTIVLRNPLERLIKFRQDLEWEEWLSNEKNDVLKSNYGLHAFLSRDGCCHGNSTSYLYYERAAQYTSRFTHIMDLGCFHDNLVQLAGILNVTVPADLLERTDRRHKSIRERIGNDTVYTHLIRLNLQELQWYQWAKSRSLVQCKNESLLDVKGLEDQLADILPLLNRLMITEE